MKNIKKSQKLYNRAKKIIPGGNMLLSKKPELYLPNGWPAYFSKAKGCHVWDLEDKKYIDIHNRFKVECSHAFKYNYLSRPIIDEWFLYFTELVRFVYPNIKLNKFKFRITPTHDIDNPRKFSLLFNQKH